jgi:hypothetical protein
MFSITMLMEVQCSMCTQIQDLHTGNEMGMNEDYHLLGCETMQMADVFENILPPSSG